MCVPSPRPPAGPFPACRFALAPSPSPTALSPPGPHLDPRFVCPPCDSAGRVGLQPAAELRYVQRHKHAGHVQCACPRPVRPPQPSPSLRAACAVSSPRPPPSHLSRPAARPRFVSSPCDSAGRGGLQPAAELQHVQRHDHVRNVCGARTHRPDFQPRAPFACMQRAAPPTALSPPGPHLDLAS